jgi:PIN domain nuclease of toxin-antitoxin system
VAHVLLDTHAWAWSLIKPHLLSDRVRSAFASGDAVSVSPISFFEIGQKVRIGRWPEMEPFVADLPELLRDQGALLAPLTPEICLDAGLRDWPHRDPFDRLLAATCLRMDVPLVTRDPVFAELGVRSIW